MTVLLNTRLIDYHRPQNDKKLMKVKNAASHGSKQRPSDITASPFSFFFGRTSA